VNRFRCTVSLMVMTIVACAALPSVWWIGVGGGMVHTGDITDPELKEISGIAASHRHPDRYWVINDGGNRPRCYAISAEGSRQMTLRIAGVGNHDWEDIASFTFDGIPYLMIADVGDNGARRRHCTLYFVQEPEFPSEAGDGILSQPLSGTLPFVYADGPRDCEAAGVDVQSGSIYLVTKRDHPPVLYRLPLVIAQKAERHVARRLTTLPHIPQPGKEEIAVSNWMRYSGQPTALDITADGQRAVVMTYRNICLYEKQPEKGWDEMLALPPRVISLPLIQQAEAACFDRSGENIILTSEKLPAPVIRVPLNRVSAVQ